MRKNGDASMTTIAALGLGLIASVAIGTQAVAGPAIASDWAELEYSQAECLDRGEAALKRMGYTAIERTRYSRFGVSSDYTISVRCVSEKGVVLFLAAGPSRQRAVEMQMELHGQYMQ
jgi:hypothetical protein